MFNETTRSVLASRAFDALTLSRIHGRFTQASAFLPENVSTKVSYRVSIVVAKAVARVHTPVAQR